MSYGSAGLIHRPASLRLPTDELIEIVFVEIRINLGLVPVACAASGQPG
jgi:hypothetical protein